MAAALVTAIGAGAVTGFWHVPAELQRFRRIVAIHGGGASAAAKPLRNTLPSALMTKATAFLADRDSGLLSGLGLSASATVLYRQWRPALPVIAAIAAIALRWGRPDLLSFIAAAVAAAILLPEIALRWLLSRRRTRIVREFPELVDLLAVAAAGGMSLAGALRAVSADGAGPLSQEVRLAVRETGAGTPLHAALRNLARRVGVPAVSAFVGSLCEAESLGAPLADSLAMQSESARTAYRQQLEARLSQLPLQMTICALVFLFPTAFIVVALPNIIAFTRGLW